MPRTGRPSKLTPETAAVILAGVAAGVPRAAAARQAGVGRRTVQGWLAKGRAARSGEYRHFLHAVQKAEADAVARNVALIQTAANDSWQAAAWWLERRYPDQFGTNRREVRELRRQLAALLEAVRRGQLPAAPPPG